LSNSSKPNRKSGPSNAPPKLHPAEAYVADVLAGKIVVSKYVRQAIERHVADLREGSKRGLYFDREDAEFAIACCKFFKHSKGKWAGQTFEPSPWQQFILWNLFGWKRKGGTRRFRRAYVEVARKNGKSTFLSVIAIILLALDCEQGAEVYSAATKKDQARIVFNEARRMVKQSPELKQFIKSFRHVLTVPDTESKFEPLSADANSLDGLNVHGGIVDELHAHKTREVWDVLDTATGSREQPLLVAITTAGFDQEGICYEVRGHCADLLDSLFEDDSYFAFIACIDEGDNWQDESCWIKANPNLGVSNSLEDLRDKAKRAIRTASARNNFLCKHLDRWTQQAQLWLPVEKWDACAADDVTLEALAGRKCYVGIDLADKLDLNAICFLFPPLPGERWKMVVYHWMPEEVMEMRCDEGQWHYKEWSKEDVGYIRLTSGNITDYDAIRDQFVEMAKKVHVLQVGYDPYNATNFATQLASKFEMVEVRPRFAHLSEGSKEFEAMVVGGKIEHDGNPLLRWQAGNVQIESDKDQNIRPIQPKDRRKKIDGIMAGVIALSRAIVTPPPTKSVYGTRGLLTL
jgi:phage terminase large subunit-like protein